MNHLIDMLISRDVQTLQILIIFNALILEFLKQSFGQGPMVTESRSINSIHALTFINKNTA